MSAPRRFTDDAIERALRRAGGIYTRAARLLRCDRGTIADYVSRSEHLQDIARESRETMLDLAEDVILSALRSNDGKRSLQAAIFVLRSQGRARGWSTNLDAPLPTTQTIKVRLTPEQIHNLSDDHLEMLCNGDTEVVLRQLIAAGVIADPRAVA